MDGNALETIAPAGREVPVAGGGVICAMPITLGQLPRFVKAIRPAFGALVNLIPAASSDGTSDGQGVDQSVDMVALLDAYAEHGEAITDAVCIATGQSRQTIEGLALDDAVAVMRAVWEVNADFFVRKVLPLLAKG